MGKYWNEKIGKKYCFLCQEWVNESALDCSGYVEPSCHHNYCATIEDEVADDGQGIQLS